jgi:hypothetical protein
MPQSGQVELEPEPLSGSIIDDDLPVLPRRRSRRGHAMPQAQPNVDWPAERDMEEDPEQAGQWMNAFLSGAAAANGDDQDEPVYRAESTSEDLR